MPALSPYDDEEKAPDFRSRYVAETKQMPTNLAAIAARNLAAEDASLAKVNAVARMNPLPAPGSPYATPETDAANFGIANAMERADLGGRFGFGSPQYKQGTETPTIADLHTDDISTRRSAIDDQKKQVMARLGIIKPADAGIAAVVLAGPHERRELLQNLQILEQEDKGLLQEHHYAAVDKARTAHENFARQKHIDASNDFANFAGRLTEIRKTTKRGTPEREEAMVKAVIDYPGALTVEAGKTLARQMAEEHDAAAKLINRIPVDKTAPEGMELGGVTRDAEGKEHASFKPTGEKEAKVPAQVKERYAKLSATIQQHEEQSASEKADNEKNLLADVPYPKAAEYHAAQTELGLLRKQFPGLSAIEPTPATTPAKRFVFNPVTKKLEPAKE